MSSGSRQETGICFCGAHHEQSTDKFRIPHSAKLSSIRWKLPTTMKRLWKKIDKYAYEMPNVLRHTALIGEMNQIAEQKFEQAATD